MRRREFETWQKAIGWSASTSKTRRPTSDISPPTVPPSPSSARFLVRAGRHGATLEGASRARNVVIEFPSYEAALACWHSPEYQEVLALRRGASEADLLVIEGYDGPPPEASRQ